MKILITVMHLQNETTKGLNKQMEEDEQGVI